MLKNTSAVKILVVVFVLCVIACGVMAAWFFLMPVENYALRLAVAQSQAKTAQEELAARTAAVQTDLELAKAENESLSLQLQQAKEINETSKQVQETLQQQIEDLQTLPEQVLQLREEYGNKICQLEEMITAGQTDVKICYLTFDDGPNSMTEAILEELDRLDAYATFFTIGTNAAPGQEENLRAEMMGGHTVANHTYSHAYSGSLYRSIEEFQKQVLKQDENVYESTGFHMDIFRFPSGSSACHFLDSAEAWLAENGYQWIDWNASAWDAGVHSFTAKASDMYYNMINTSKEHDIAVLLCHDFNVATYGALKLFIPEMQELGYVFLPLLPQSHMFDEPLPVV